MRVTNEKRLSVEKQDLEHKTKKPLRWDGLDFLLRLSLIRKVGLRNALDVRVENVELAFTHLPKGFDNLRILFITDPHLDGTNPLVDKILSIFYNIDYDYCILGGDYIYGRHGHSDQAYSQIEKIVKTLKNKSRVFGILGNYDLNSTGQFLDALGVEMLVNEGVCIESKADRLYLAGIDDPSHYKADDIALADGNAWKGAFKIMVCHSPTKYKESAEAGYSLYLTGDTHGGQICLPGGFVPSCGPTATRKTVSGKWEYKGMIGYTSRGVGTSWIKVRYFCPPEVTVITLKRKTNKRHILRNG
jgi:predicted MPP superfamily phosphohydrolase